MKQIERVLTQANVDEIANEFIESLAAIGESIHGMRGVALFTALKRDKLVGGPYPGVSLFEAANRIMSDLVILRGVAGLLKEEHFPFSSYTVEFGNENKNGFDIRATSRNTTLVGEAFNVAPSFFQVKKRSALRKLRAHGPESTYKVLMFNDDAASTTYLPKSEAGLHHILVGVHSGAVQVRPNPSIERTSSGKPEAAAHVER
ncbi:hypothetical protein [Ideonella sp. BN130291]|uniref:hypothetical protein n=1 Tax=Ideonella sp. BN130291 TaxID=3112940 RepID=UPI002E26591B|nr:hypothetical protein [Ideonella sp. BN130291]